MTTIHTSTFALPDLGKAAPAAARRALAMLQSISHSCLHMTLPDGRKLRFGNEHGPHAAIELHNWQLFGATLRSGDIGFAESFIGGAGTRRI